MDALVLDVGSSMFKAGFAGDDAPRFDIFFFFIIPFFHIFKLFMRRERV